MAKTPVLRKYRRKSKQVKTRNKSFSNKSRKRARKHKKNKQTLKRRQGVKNRRTRRILTGGAREEDVKKVRKMSNILVPLYNELWRIHRAHPISIDKQEFIRSFDYNGEEYEYDFYTSAGQVYKVYKDESGAKRYDKSIISSINNILAEEAKKMKVAEEAKKMKEEARVREEEDKQQPTRGEASVQRIREAKKMEKMEESEAEAVAVATDQAHQLEYEISAEGVTLHTDTLTDDELQKLIRLMQHEFWGNPEHKGKYAQLVIKYSYIGGTTLFIGSGPRYKSVLELGMFGNSPANRGSWEQSDDVPNSKVKLRDQQLRHNEKHYQEEILPIVSRVLSNNGYVL